MSTGQKTHNRGSYICIRRLRAGGTANDHHVEALAHRHLPHNLPQPPFEPIAGDRLPNLLGYGEAEPGIGAAIGRNAHPDIGVCQRAPVYVGCGKIRLFT